MLKEQTRIGVEGENIMSPLKATITPMAGEPTLANAKEENTGSILKPMSSVRSTSEAAKGLGTTGTPLSTALGSKQGASFATILLEDNGVLNPWSAVDSTFQSNTTEDACRELTRIFVRSILGNAIESIMSGNLETISS